MREIKFRAKRIYSGEWIYGQLVIPYIERTHILPDGTIKTIGPQKDAAIYNDLIDPREPWKTVDPDTVGQFTGLTDRNGEEIYEGDIFTVKGKHPRVVLWDKMRWALMPTEYFHDEIFWVMNLQHPGVDWWEEFADEFEVIGNIFDNPELIPATDK